MPDLEKSTISIKPSSIVADGVTTATIKIQLKKGNKNITESSGLVTLIRGESAIGEVSDVVDNKDGTYTATIKSTSLGAELIGFKLNDQEATAKAEISFIEKQVKPTVTMIHSYAKDGEAKEAEVHKDMVEEWKQLGWQIKE